MSEIENEIENRISQIRTLLVATATYVVDHEYSKAITAVDNAEFGLLDIRNKLVALHHKNEAGN